MIVEANPVTILSDATRGLPHHGAREEKVRDSNPLGSSAPPKHEITIRRQVQGQTNKTVEVVPPKHGSERVVSIPEDLTSLLSEHISTFGVWGGEGWLFGSEGYLLHRNAAGPLWRQVREARGLTDYTLHDLRHV